MNTNKTSRISLILAVALVAGGAIAVGYLQPTHAQPSGGSMAGPRYSIVETQGHNLIVTDNQSNQLYFYTVDRDKDVGSELKLRGQVDLNQVGKPIIKPTTHKSEP